jgi:DNA repair protein RadC
MICTSAPKKSFILNGRLTGAACSFLEVFMTYEIVSERKIRNPVDLKRPENVYPLVKRYGKAKQEYFIVITLNGTHQPISVSIVHIGLVNRTIVHPREVFYRAIRDMAAAVIVCHNHPSGSLHVSPEDLDITKALCEAGKIIGIRVIDHIIISKAGYLSLLKSGQFPRDEEAGARTFGYAAEYFLGGHK